MLKMLTTAVVDKSGTTKTISPPDKTETPTEIASLKPVVSTARKQTLLLEARRARVEWVDASSFLLKKPQVDRNSKRLSVSSLLPEEDGFSLLRSSRVGELMKSATDVISTLYSLDDVGSSGSGGLSPEEAGERISKQLSSQISSVDVKKILGVALDGSHKTGSIPDSITDVQDVNKGEEGAIPHYEVSSVTSSAGAHVYSEKMFSSFLRKLRSPESAELVQGMRHFVHSFDEMAISGLKSLNANQQENKLKATQEYASKEDQKEESNDKILSSSRDGLLKNLSGKLNGYVSSTFLSLTQNPLWIDESEDELENSKRSLETFLYYKCHDSIWKVLKTGQEDSNLSLQISNLKFLQPSHFNIEIHQHLIQTPIHILNGLSCAASPLDKLQLVHEVYLSLIPTLKIQSDMPSADDILPSLIYTLIQVNPDELFLNLKFVEIFTPNEQHRKGEIGYSFTNLYGAATFLNDLDVDNDGNITKSFDINWTEFRDGLEKCQKQQMQSLNTSKDQEDSNPQNIMEEDSEQLPLSLSSEMVLPVSAIRAARLRGETLDEEWAMKWFQQNVPSSSPTLHSNIADTVSHEEEESATNFSDISSSFTRSYTFLGKQPDDIRCSDIPGLLTEYHELIRLSEKLLIERNTIKTEEHKRMVKMERDKLESNVAAVVAATESPAGKL